MSGPITLDALDLAALLCSRVCHDLISPAGAIVNGLEVLEESKDEETKIFALDLIKKSARTASARLQFCRIAFGAAGTGIRATVPIPLTPSARRARPDGALIATSIRSLPSASNGADGPLAITRRKDGSGGRLTRFRLRLY